MSRPLYRRRQLFGLIAAIVATNFAIAINSLAQTADLPKECSAYASIPLPPEAQQTTTPKTSPSCASYRSYRGIGRPVNYSAARSCAWQERLAQKAGLTQNEQEPTAWVVGGSLILADIYFNGAGVKRNIPLAMRFACEFEEGAVQIALPDIAKLNDVPRAHSPFEFCDYAATTFTMNFCAGYESEVEDDRRGRYYNSLKSSMTPEQRTAFESLLSAQSAFINAHASEVDQGGTIRDIRIIGSQSILEDLFHTEIVHFERKQWPKLSADQIAAADPLLNREYQKQIVQLRKQTKDEIDEGGVIASSLSKVEESWNTYRDAWIAFARLRYPAAVPAIRAQITLDRYRFLKTIS